MSTNQKEQDGISEKAKAVFPGAKNVVITGGTFTATSGSVTVNDCDFAPRFPGVPWYGNGSDFAINGGGSSPSWSYTPTSTSYYDLSPFERAARASDELFAATYPESRIANAMLNDSSFSVWGGSSFHFNPYVDFSTDASNSYEREERRRRREERNRRRKQRQAGYEEFNSTATLEPQNGRISLSESTKIVEVADRKGKGKATEESYEDEQAIDSDEATDSDEAPDSIEATDSDEATYSDEATDSDEATV